MSPQPNLIVLERLDKTLMARIRFDPTGKVANLQASKERLKLLAGQSAWLVTSVRITASVAAYLEFLRWLEAVDMQYLDHSSTNVMLSKDQIYKWSMSAVVHQSSNSVFLS